VAVELRLERRDGLYLVAFWMWKIDGFIGFEELFTPLAVAKAVSRG
jgi:hypothetical protein